MKIKNKIVKIILSLTIFISMISVFIVITIIYKKASNTEIIENQTEEKEEPTIKEKDFANSALNINFSIEQKIYIVNFVNINSYFNIDEFKYYFILEFNKLGPLNPDINLLFQINDKNKPRKILINYKTKNNLYKWYFSLI